MPLGSQWVSASSCNPGDRKLYLEWKWWVDSWRDLSPLWTVRTYRLWRKLQWNGVTYTMFLAMNIGDHLLSLLSLLPWPQTQGKGLGASVAISS